MAHMKGQQKPPRAASSKLKSMICQTQRMQRVMAHSQSQASCPWPKSTDNLCPPVTAIPLASAFTMLPFSPMRSSA
eukprot:1137700-Pelagomonas_calceolata.AAC.1